MNAKTFQEMCAAVFGHFYVSYLWSHSYLLAHHPAAAYLVFYVILTTSNGEHVGLFLGSTFGSIKPLPYLSPNKTVV